MKSAKHEQFEKNFNDNGETPIEIPPINPNNANNKTYKNTSVLK